MTTKNEKGGATVLVVRPTVELRHRRAEQADLILRNITVDENGCWLWTGSINEQGYGRPGWKGQRRYTHQLAYEAFVGPLPSGTLDHRCHTDDPGCAAGRACQHRRCCNPFHLDPCTRADNIARGRGNHAKTACKNGHPFDEANTRVSLRARGVTRVCRICERASQAAHDQRKADRLRSQGLTLRGTPRIRALPARLADPQHGRTGRAHNEEA